MARLIIRYPNNVIKEVDFEAPNYRIGSSPENDLVLENEGVEPFQAQIETHDGTYSIIDVSENKSTTVNGKKIERSNLNYGDRISFGPVIGLFYPSQKKKMGDKTKIILYIGTGAFVIIASIVAIFFFTTKRISTEVSTQLGEPVLKKEVIEIPEPDRSFPAPLSREEKAKPEIVEVPAPGVEKSKGLFASFSNLFTKEELKLPEPTPEDIAARKAVAVPTGLGKIFFRKIPVKVKAQQTVDKIEESFEQEEVIKPPAETKARGEEPSELVPQAESKEEQVSGDQIISPEEEPEKGFFQKILSPVTNLFKRESREEGIEVEEPVSETTAFPIEERPAPAEPSSPSVTPPQPEVEELLKVQDPLAFLRSIDVKEVISPELKEEPVYTETEIEAFMSQNLLGRIELSTRENINTNVLWKYPEVVLGREEEAPGHFIRAGAIGNINNDKFYDIVMVSDQGSLLALSGDSGAELLIQEIDGECYPPFLEDMNGDGQEDIIITTPDGRIHVYDQSLQLLWLYQGKEKITSAPLLLDLNRDKTKDIVFPFLNMEILAVDGNTGVKMWRFFDAQSEIVFSPSGVDLNKDGVGDVVFVTRGGILYALDGKTGWGLWNTGIYGEPSGEVCIADLNGDRETDILTLTSKGLLAGFNREGKILFSLELNDTYSTPPSVGDLDGDGNNDIVVISQKGVVRAFEARTRREKWNFETDEGSSLGRPALCDVNLDGNLDVVISTLSGLILVIDGVTGSDLAQFNSGGYIFSTPLVCDINKDKIPDIITATHGGLIYALQVADVKKPFFKLKSSFWSARNHDNQNTGFSPYYILKKSWK